MTDARSTHLPEVTGGIVEVTESAVINTQLRNVQTFSLCLAQQSAAAEAIVNGVLGEPSAGGDQPLTIEVFAADGVTPGVAAVNVAWMAVGK